MLQQSLAVFLVLALLLAALSLLRRQGLATYGFPAGPKGFGRRNNERRLRVIERLALTPQHSLHLVSMGDQMAVFATSPTACERVDTVPAIPARCASADRILDKRCQEKRCQLLILASASMLGAALPVADALQSIGVKTSAGAAGTTLSLPMQIALGMTLLSVLPAIVMCLTPFLRIIIVLHFLRQALGTQTAPSNQVLVGLSLFLSLLVVQPVLSDVYNHAWQPLEKGDITTEQAYENGAAPMRKFLVRFARERDIRLFVEMSNEPAPRGPSDISLKILIPAYILSELKAGFQIGVVLFLPFLVIDIAVASVTLSIGMMQLPPALISAPFKILLFVLVDGWNLVIGALMKSFLQS